MAIDPTTINGITIGGKPVFLPPADYLLPMNHFSWHTGASRPGTGRFLMKRADYTTIAAAATQQLVMKSAQGSSDDDSSTLNVTVTIAGAVPIFPATEYANDLVAVIVYDQRVNLVKPKTYAFNMAIAGVQPAAYYKATQDTGEDADADGGWTWDSLLDFVEVNTDNLTTPDWKPRNIAYDGVAECRILDDLAAKLFAIAGWKEGDDDELQFYDVDTLDEDNEDLLSEAQDYLIAGGDVARNNPQRLPASIDVTFPAFNCADDDAYSTTARTYKKTVATGYGSANVNQSLHVGEYQAIKDPTGWLNQSELDAVATDLVTRWINKAGATISEKTYAGIWPFTPDGRIRNVMFISDAGGARTIVNMNNEDDLSPMADSQRASNTTQNTLLVGTDDTRFEPGVNGGEVLRAPGIRFYSATITEVTAKGHYKGNPIRGPLDPSVSGGISEDTLGTKDTAATIQILNVSEIKGGTALQTGQVVTGPILYWNAEDDPTKPVPIMVIGIGTQGALLGEVVCNGPHGEDDFTDNRQWVQVKKIIAPCDPSEPWTLVDADEISEPCPTEDDGSSSSSGTLPNIVGAFNVGESVSQDHAQPGKLVLLTPLESHPTGTTTGIRWACEFIDRTDNGRSCGSSSSSSSSSSGPAKCYSKYTVTYDCNTGVVGSLASGDDFCAPSDTHDKPHTIDAWTLQEVAGSVCTLVYYQEGGDCPDSGGCPSDSLGPPAAPSVDLCKELCGCDSSSSGGSSSKSSAIVPASWSKAGYTALFIVESPEVRFEDVLEVKMPQRNAVVELDPKFAEVCVENTLEVCGHSISVPVAVGLQVNRGKLHVKFARQSKRKQCRLVVKLTGIRKGFYGTRFPDRSVAEFTANERFLRAAYPAAPRADPESQRAGRGK